MPSSPTQDFLKDKSYINSLSQRLTLSNDSINEGEPQGEQVVKS